MTGISSTKRPRFISPSISDVEEPELLENDAETSKKTTVNRTKDIDAFFDAPEKVGAISRRQCIICKLASSLLILFHIITN